MVEDPQLGLCRARLPPALPGVDVAVFEHGAGVGVCGADGGFEGGCLGYEAGAGLGWFFGFGFFEFYYVVDCVESVCEWGRVVGIGW